MLGMFLSTYVCLSIWFAVVVATTDIRTKFSQIKEITKQNEISYQHSTDVEKQAKTRYTETKAMPTTKHVQKYQRDKTEKRQGQNKEYSRLTTRIIKKRAVFKNKTSGRKNKNSIRSEQKQNIPLVELGHKGIYNNKSNVKIDQNAKVTFEKKPFMTHHNLTGFKPFKHPRLHKYNSGLSTKMTNFTEHHKKNVSEITPNAHRYVDYTGVKRYTTKNVLHMANYEGENLVGEKAAQIQSGRSIDRIEQSNHIEPSGPIGEIGHIDPIGSIESIQPIESIEPIQSIEDIEEIHPEPDGDEDGEDRSKIPLISKPPLMMPHGNLLLKGLPRSAAEVITRLHKQRIGEAIGVIHGAVGARGVKYVADGVKHEAEGVTNEAKGVTDPATGVQNSNEGVKTPAEGVTEPALGAMKRGSVKSIKVERKTTIDNLIKNNKQVKTTNTKQKQINQVSNDKNQNNTGGDETMNNTTVANRMKNNNNTFTAGTQQVEMNGDNTSVRNISTPVKTSAKNIKGATLKHDEEYSSANEFLNKTDGFEKFGISALKNKLKSVSENNTATNNASTESSKNSQRAKDLPTVNFTIGLSEKKRNNTMLRNTEDENTSLCKNKTLNQKLNSSNKDINKTEFISEQSRQINRLPESYKLQRSRAGNSAPQTREDNTTAADAHLRNGEYVNNNINTAAEIHLRNNENVNKNMFSLLGERNGVKRIVLPKAPISSINSKLEAYPTIKEIGKIKMIENKMNMETSEITSNFENEQKIDDIKPPKMENPTIEKIPAIKDIPKIPAIKDIPKIVLT